MKRIWICVGVAAWCTGLSGCGDSGTAQTTQTTQTTQEERPATTDQAAAVATETRLEPVELPVNASSSPHDVVLAFLNAMRDGNGRVTAALLTSKAQEETIKHDWPVQPPGAPTATYQLGPARYADAGQSAVCVPCVWTESDAQAGPTRFEVEWRMHREPEGWRVAGFASEVVEGKGPSYFNFVDIANLKETQSAIEAAMAAAAGEPSQQPVAQQPSSDSAFR